MCYSLGVAVVTKRGLYSLFNPLLENRQGLLTQSITAATFNFKIFLAFFRLSDHKLPDRVV